MIDTALVYHCQLNTPSLGSCRRRAPGRYAELRVWSARLERY